MRDEAGQLLADADEQLSIDRYTGVVTVRVSRMAAPPMSNHHWMAAAIGPVTTESRYTRGQWRVAYCATPWEAICGIAERERQKRAHRR